MGGPPFLDAGVLEARRNAAENAGDAAVWPDPRPAVLEFARFLGRRGIRLVLFPVPDKASLQPLELHGRSRDVGGRRSGTQPELRLDSTAELERAGVFVFDPAPAALHAGDAAVLHAAGHPLDAGLDGDRVGAAGADSWWRAGWSPRGPRLASNAAS